MIDMEFLNAIDKLPEVGVPILRQRDGVLNLLSCAEDLRRRADLIEDQAMQVQKALKVRVAKHWAVRELEATMKRTRTASTAQDEIAGMAWWNGMLDAERARWGSFVGTGVAADAWASFKQLGCPRLPPDDLDDREPL